MSAVQPGSEEEPPAPGGSSTRDRLVSAASHLLAEGGHGAVTLRGVGDRAGVSRSAPYRHFDDKDDLLTAVLMEAFARLFQEMTTAMAAAPTDTPEALRRGLRAYIRFGLAWPEHYLLLFGEHMVNVEAGTLTRVAPEGIDLFESIIAQGQRAGELRPGDARDMTLLTWSALHGLVIFGISGLLSTKGIDHDEALHRLVAELVAGLEA